MFEVGDYVVYRNNGVCKVEDIGPMDLPGSAGSKQPAEGRLYYTLVPIYAKGSKLYTPTDNEKVIIRPVISREAADELIDNIQDIETLWITDAKRRESVYKEALLKCDCREWIKIIKTLYLHQQSRIAEGKKATASDEKYLRIAEDNLYGELAIPLKMDKDMVEEFIIERVNAMEHRKAGDAVLQS